MPEAATQALLLAAAVLSSVAGCGWLALAMEPHWQQVRGGREAPSTIVRGLRVLGSGALASSLALCLAADHPSMAALVWVMALAAGALVTALLLAWRPNWLGLLLGPVGRPRA